MEVKSKQSSVSKVAMHEGCLWDVEGMMLCKECNTKVWNQQGDLAVALNTIYTLCASVFTLGHGDSKPSLFSNETTMLLDCSTLPCAQGSSLKDVRRVLCGNDWGLKNVCIFQTEIRMLKYLPGKDQDL